MQTLTDLKTLQALNSTNAQPYIGQTHSSAYSNSHYISQALIYIHTHSATQTLLNRALWKACRDGEANIIASLVCHGAQINATNADSPSRFSFPFDLRTWTALHFAASYGHVSCVKKLCQLGAHVNARTKTHGWTPLHYAAHDGHDEVCMTLLDRGANVLAPTRTDGATPMHLAAMNVRIFHIRTRLTSTYNEWHYCSHENGNADARTYSSSSITRSRARMCVCIFVHSGTQPCIHRTI
jgi:hypothetical protein